MAVQVVKDWGLKFGTQAFQAFKYIVTSPLQGDKRVNDAATAVMKSYARNRVDASELKKLADEVRAPLWMGKIMSTCGLLAIGYAWYRMPRIFGLSYFLDATCQAAAVGLLVLRHECMVAESEAGRLSQLYKEKAGNSEEKAIEKEALDYALLGFIDTLKTHLLFGEYLFDSSEPTSFLEKATKKINALQERSPKASQSDFLKVLPEEVGSSFPNLSKVFSIGSGLLNQAKGAARKSPSETATPSTLENRAEKAKRAAHQASTLSLLLLKKLLVAPFEGKNESRRLATTLFTAYGREERVSAQAISQLFSEMYTPAKLGLVAAVTCSLLAAHVWWHMPYIPFISYVTSLVSGAAMLFFTACAHDLFILGRAFRGLSDDYRSDFESVERKKYKEVDWESFKQHVQGEVSSARANLYLGRWLFPEDFATTRFLDEAKENFRSREEDGESVRPIEEIVGEHLPTLGVLFSAGADLMTEGAPSSSEE